jgi:cytosine deaminase
MQSHPVQTRTARELADAGVAVVVLPQTNLYLNAVGVDTAPPRGIAPVTMLVGAGVVVAAGSDNLQDPFNPVGDADPLHTASLMVTAAHQLPELALRQISEAGRAVLGLAPAGVSPGMVADLVAVPAGDEASLIAECRPDRMVISRGRLVASTSIEHHVWR